MLHAKESLRKMYSVAKNYCGGPAASDMLSVFDLRRSVSSSSKASRHVIPFRAHLFAQCSLGGSSADQEIVIALGSNVGDRISTFDRALRLMRNSGINITRHACLYETAPAYVTDQPCFLNSAVRGTTKLGPHELLKQLKEIEKHIGRTGGIRYGPRPIDLDILLYGSSQINTETLIVPHERIHERPFVLAPLVDLLGSSADDGMETSWHSLSKCSGGFFELWNKLGGECTIGTEGIKRVLPVGNRLLDWCERTLVMGVLNLTPDSFSDGGKFQEVDAAISQAKLLISAGADIIDIGAQSTRPFARRLSANEELERLVPVLHAITKIPEMEGKLLSVDTFYAEVATEAVKRGVHMINDVSSGQLDPRILKVVAELGVPYVAMHMRGDPSNMQSEQNLQYVDVCKEVASELYARVREVELSGIPLWRIVLDPGIGFSKKSRHNLEVIMGLESIRRELGRRDYRSSDFRGRIDRRFSPRRRHSPGKDSRGHRALHDRRPTSRERESSYSRSPSRKSERRYDKKTDDGETNSSRSLSVSDNNDDRKKDKFSSGDEKEGHEKQLKQIRLDMEVLREDKSHLEIILDEKIDEMRKISSKVNDLDQQLKREKEECHKMTSKMKKFIKAHARFLKAQEELKRSQARFERLGDLLASDILKRGANEEVSSVNVDEDPNGPYERSPNAAATKKRSIPYSTSEEAKAVKKRRGRDSDTITRPEKYRSEGAVTDFDKTSKGTEATKSLYLKKKLWEEKIKLGNVSSANVFSDKVKDSPVNHVLPSTGMAAHAIDDLNEAVELEDRHEPIDASLENDADDKTRSPVMPPQPPPPVVQNAYVQYEGDDEEVDVE